MNQPFVVHDVLSRFQAEELRDAIERGAWRDGRETAGSFVGSVKNNKQLSEESARPLLDALAGTIRRNDLFAAAVRPVQIAMMFNRYEVDEEYGVHVDAPTMAGPMATQIRRDVSFTLALSDPASYDGGDLVIETPFQEIAHRLDMGSMIVYPATSLHRVKPVTHGVRYAAVGWARSFIRDAAKRELMFELDAVRGALFEREGKTPEVDLLGRCSANLMRMWMED